MNGTAEPDGAGRGRFATTQWSLVLAAAKRDSSEAEEALARLCALDWYPLCICLPRELMGERGGAAKDLSEDRYGVEGALTAGSEDAHEDGLSDGTSRCAVAAGRLAIDRVTVVEQVKREADALVVQAGSVKEPVELRLDPPAARAKAMIGDLLLVATIP